MSLQKKWSEYTSKSTLSSATVAKLCVLDENPLINTTITVKDLIDWLVANDLVAPKVSPTFTGTVVLPQTTSIGNVSKTELGCLDGVTANIQTQLDSKQTSDWDYHLNAATPQISNVSNPKILCYNANTTVTIDPVSFPDVGYTLILKNIGNISTTVKIISSLIDSNDVDPDSGGSCVLSGNNSSVMLKYIGSNAWITIGAIYSTNFTYNGGMS